MMISSRKWIGWSLPVEHYLTTQEVIVIIIAIWIYGQAIPPTTIYGQAIPPTTIFMRLFFVILK